MTSLPDLESNDLRSSVLGAVIRGQNDALELSLRGAPLASILSVLVRTIEDLSPHEVLGSILLLEGKRLRLGAAPSLPAHYNAAVDGLPIGPAAGSCGTCAYTAQPVVVRDIATDPVWEGYRDLALASELRSCWSTPIMSSEGTVLGTFALYYRDVRDPTPHDRQVVDLVTHTAALIIERKQQADANSAAADALRRSESKYVQALESLPVAVYTCDAQGRIVFFNSAAATLWGREPEVGKELWCGSYRMFRTDGTPLELAECPMAIALKERRPVKAEAIVARPSGEWRHVLAHPQPLFGDRGEFVGAINILVDITDRKHAEEELVATKDDLSDQVSTLTRLHDLAVSLSKERNLQPALEAILRTVIDAHGADFGVLSIYEPSTGDLRGDISVGFDAEARRQIERLRPGLGVGACGHAFATRERTIIVDTESDPKFAPFLDLSRSAGFRSLHSTPILTRGGEVLGVLSVHFKEPRAPSKRETQLADMCALHMADALEVARAQASLRESEERLRLALGSAGSGVWDWHVATGKVTWSAGLEAIHGLAPGSFGGTFEDFQRDIHPDDKARVLASIENAVSTRSMHYVEYRVVLPSGATRWVEARGEPVVDDQGRPVRLVGVCVDITARKQAEEARALLQSLVESSSDAIISESLDGTITSWNEGARRLFGYEAEEMVGRSITILSPPGLVDQASGLVAAARQGEAIKHFETVRRHRDGRLLHVQLSVSPVRGPDGEIVGLSKIARDVSEDKARREREYLLAEASDLLASSLDYNMTLTNLAKIAVPRLADWYSVDVADEQGVLRNLASEHRDASRIDWAHEIHQKHQLNSDKPVGAYKVFRTGAAEYYPDVDAALLDLAADDEGHRAVLRELGIRSAMLVPLAARGRTFGALTFLSTDSGRRFSEADFHCAKELGRKAGLAIENARLFKEAQDALLKYKAELQERERIEAALRNSERLYRAIGEAINYGIWICDPSGRNIYASESFLKLTGLTQEECSAFGWGSALHPDDAERTVEAWKECVRTHGVWDRVHRVRGVDGEWHPVLARGVPVRDENGQVIFWAGINLDVSRQQEAEDDLRRAKEAADAASAAKSTFLANMSHEIRTPLGAILGFSELLMTPGQSPADQQECVDIIRRNGQLLSTLINDILDLSKVEAGKLMVERKPVRLESILEEIRSGLNLYAAEKGILLSVRTIGQAPHRIETDEFRLKQILNNIVGNAIKFTDKGSVTVSLQLVAKEKGKELLYFEVTDTGRGISSEQAARLFESFTQADASTSRRYGGTGLGLVLSRKLARLLGGDVVLLRSEPSVGSTFAISIDPGSVVSSSASDERGGSARRHQIDAQQFALRGLRVLVVDDAPDNRLLISRYLRSAGATVLTAEHGEQAIEKVQAGECDVVLMDVQMPVMDGHMATKELRRLGYRLPIVALTAHAMREEREHCLAIGFDDYYSKPIDRVALLSGLQKYTLASRPGGGSTSRTLQ